MRITSKGQVTIPQAMHEQTGRLPNTDIEFAVDGTSVRIIKVSSGKRASRWQRAVDRLRQQAGSIRMSTAEIMAVTRGDE